LAKTKRITVTLLLIAFVLQGFGVHVFAEQLNNSVKECIEQPDKCSQKGETPDQTTKQAVQDPQVGLNAWDFIKMIFATIFVVALLYFLLKVINAKSKKYKSTQLVENLGGTTLGMNRSVQLVKVGNRILVVGVGENVQLLKEIEDFSEYSQMIKDYNEKMDQHLQPSDIVTKVLQRRRNKSSDEKNGNPDQRESSQFQDLLNKQLEDISSGRKRLFREMEQKGPDER